MYVCTLPNVSELLSTGSGECVFLLGSTSIGSVTRYKVVVADVYRFMEALSYFLHQTSLVTRLLGL